jgi:hypothetical protein
MAAYGCGRGPGTLSAVHLTFDPASMRGPGRNDLRLVTRRVDELRPHPSYSRHGLTVSACQLSALMALDDQVLEEPIAIKEDGLIIDGYARVERARQLGRTTILCIEHNLTEEEALRELLRRHLGCNELNPFSRILLARELEPWFKEKALENQKAGGENKGSSKLTEAERVDVTAKIAEAADASVGNISKVKQLLRTAVPELLQALLRDEISINAGWLLSKKPSATQREELAIPQCKRNIKKDMRILASRHGSKSLPTVPDLSKLINQLSALESSKPGSIPVFVIDAPGRAVCLTKELLLELGAQQELLPPC